VAFFISLSLCSSPVYCQIIPPPETFLGFKIGDDYQLADYKQAIAYFRELEASSERIKLFSIGKTSFDQDMKYAVISSAENIKNLENYKTFARQLALAQGLTDESAADLAAKAKAIVYIDGGLHASECAPAQHNIQLAYELVVTEDPHWLKVLDDVILVLVFANPDGMNILADWYRQNIGTPYEVSSLPWLYHKYVGHDNNRDSYMLTMNETKALNKITNQIWYPQIVYNHHQTAPFPARIWTPPNAEPTNPNVHPLLVRWQNLIGSAMGMAFDQQGKQGAISRIVFDSWYPGYVTQVCDAHNVISILTETALYRYATPHFYTVHDFPEAYQDFTIAAFYPNPWKGGWWRLSDAVEYCLIASKCVLETASRMKQPLLLDRYRMARDVIKRFENEPPFGWIVPEKQSDPGSAEIMLNNLIELAVDVYRARTGFKQDGLDYPAGTYVIPTSQPFGLFVKNMLEEQKYPDLRNYPHLWQGLIQLKKFDGAPLRSYDIAGWTLPLQMNVNAIQINSPLKVELEKVKKAETKAGKIFGSARYGYVLDHHQNKSFIAISRIQRQGGTVLWTTQPFTQNKIQYPTGTIIVPAVNLQKGFMINLADELAINIRTVAKKPAVVCYELKKPRIGLYKSWVASMDEGWTRWLFEQFEIPFENIHDAEIKAGQLNQRFDVVVLPSQSSKIILEGHQLGTMPPEYIGGIGTGGLQNLKSFVENGGTVIGFNSSCDLLIETFELPASNILKDVKSEQFVCSGSILKIEYDTTHPIAYGMEELQPGVFNRSPAFKIHPSFNDNQTVKAVAKYPKQKLLLSGFIHGEELLHQKVAVADALVKKGRVILLGFSVKNRAQAHGSFKLLFNSVYYAAAELQKQ
ncbi:MAG TPA: hypothetical protein ENN22_00325, partial [bacterium]|nr:hypothetical protein [bacterium]